MVIYRLLNQNERRCIKAKADADFKIYSHVLQD